MSVSVSDAARADAARAVRYYNSRPGRYGNAFRAEVRQANRRIGAAPRQFPLVEDVLDRYEFREFLIERFDQRVIFRMDGDHARVVAIVHASATPTGWHSRADD